MRQVKLESAYRRWRQANGQEVVRVARLSLRYTYPAEMEALLADTGFELVQRYSDWARTPFRPDSPVMICLCRKAAK